MTLPKVLITQESKVLTKKSSKEDLFKETDHYKGVTDAKGVQISQNL